jgi:hypothetical protein
MTEEEQTRVDDLTAWGVYCRDVADVTFARWQEIQRAVPDEPAPMAITPEEITAAMRKGRRK